MRNVGYAEILLAEDSPADVRLTQEAFAEGGLPARLHVVPNGLEALRFLRKEDEYGEAPEPDLILLDLNMPRMDGREFLGVVKQDAEYRHIPVIVLTTSAEADDVRGSYSSHANCYIRKPMTVDGYFSVVKSVEDFWFGVVNLPPHN